MSAEGGTLAARPSPLASTNIAVLIILAVAVATRMVTYGNPVADPDDQFYLLVGDAMRHGVMPYTGIWDRKPFGLFALFAGMAAIGNGSILVMQLIATLFAAATAMVIRRIALFFAGGTAALLAGCAYLLMLPLFSGQAGQAPVFYNLFMALAALALLMAAGRVPASVRRLAFAAMLGCGLALSFKPVAVVEGAYVGLAFLWLLAKGNDSRAKLLATAAVMIVIALLPTLLPMAGYALAGREAYDIFFHANFVSIFQKTSLGTTARTAGVLYFMIYISALMLFATIGMARILRHRAEPIRGRLLLGWLAAAVGGYLLVPAFFDQYALPLLVPLSVAAAAAFDGRSGWLYAGALTFFCMIAGPIIAWRGNRDAAATYQRVSDTVDRARRGGCILVNDGPTWLHQSTGACAVTRYIFPGHLNLITEVSAVGIDTVAETRRILSTRPAVVITQQSAVGRHNPATERLLRDELAQHYQLIAMTGSNKPRAVATLRVWQRRDLAPTPRVPTRL